jgi:hypothetical protein
MFKNSAGVVALYIREDMALERLMEGADRRAGEGREPRMFWRSSISERPVKLQNGNWPET